jgi:hypothetical protein
MLFTAKAPVPVISFLFLDVGQNTTKAKLQHRNKKSNASSGRPTQLISLQCGQPIVKLILLYGTGLDDV